MTAWQCILLPGQTKTIKAPLNNVLHLSSACLDDEAAEGSFVTVLLKQNNKRLQLAALREGLMESRRLDLYLDLPAATFAIEGSTRTHLVGCFVPLENDCKSNPCEDEVENEVARPKIQAATAAKLGEQCPETAKLSTNNLPGTPPGSRSRSPVPSRSRTSKKPRWADMEDDDDDESEVPIATQTQAGPKK